MPVDMKRLKILGDEKSGRYYRTLKPKRQFKEVISRNSIV